MPTYNFQQNAVQQYTYDELATGYVYPGTSVSSPQIQRTEFAPKDNDGFGYLANTTGGYTNGEAFPNRSDPTKYNNQNIGRFNASTLVYNSDNKTRYGITGGSYLFSVTRKHQP